MRKSFFILLATILLSSCATPKLTNTVWQTAVPVSNGEEEGLLISSMYFQKNGSVNFYNAIVNSSSMVVEPYKFAEGT